MLKYNIEYDKETMQDYITTDLFGKSILSVSLLNKGTAFDYEERYELGLLGKLPAKVETLEEQMERAYNQYSRKQTDLDKNIFLNSLHDKNEILFYALISAHLVEMTPMVYTPVVGSAVKSFSQEFRQPRGLYISYPEQDRILEMLENRTNPDVKLIVVTDGERVLGIGDQGVGGMDISVAKLTMYTLCGGINPYNVLPVFLDVGTNNEILLNDPFYLGWKNKRIPEPEYHDFLDKFINAVKEKLPDAFIHIEDVHLNNARYMLEHYNEKTCMLNDDVQGTAVVTTAAILTAIKRKGQLLKDQKIIIFGAGAAGTGIAHQIVEAMQRIENLNEEEAHARIYLIDKDGVLTDKSEDVKSMQRPFLRKSSEINEWNNNPEYNDLENAVANISPTILIGCSAVSGAFSERAVKLMYKNERIPVILPLSNPNQKTEATPIDLLKWTEGNVLMAFGSPFEAVEYEGKTYSVAQCNNALAFPGIGLGVVASHATKLTKNMLWAAAMAITDFSEQNTTLTDEPLLPGLQHYKFVAKSVAKAVFEQAVAEKVSNTKETDATAAIEKIYWTPVYRKIRKKLS